MADKRPKITTASKRALNRLLEAAHDHAFKGAMHPDAYESIEDEYQGAIDGIHRRFAKLENKDSTDG
mgnify:FL=1